MNFLGAPLKRYVGEETQIPVDLNFLKGEGNALPIIILTRNLYFKLKLLILFESLPIFRYH